MFNSLLNTKIAEMYISNEHFRIFIFENPYFKTFLLIKLFYRCELIFTPVSLFWEYDTEVERQNLGFLVAYSFLNHLIPPFCPNITFSLLSLYFSETKMFKVNPTYIIWTSFSTAKLQEKCLYCFYHSKTHFLSSLFLSLSLSLLSFSLFAPLSVSLCVSLSLLIYR